MINSILILLAFVWLPLHANGTNCEFMLNEIDQFKYFSPAPKIIYRAEIQNCRIDQINGVITDDYFNIESDVRLMYIYRSFNLETTHPLLLAYMIDYKRWDLLLMTMDITRKMDLNTQVMVLNKLFYEPLPQFFVTEIKEVFNFFTASEKISVSQQLIPNTPFEIKHLNKRNNYIFEFWPIFDQMVFINHLKELYPRQFEKFAEFWQKELVSYYYEDVFNQDPSFKLLSQILNKDINLDPIDGANPSLQAYYYLKINAFNQLADMITQDKTIFLNLIRYFELYSIDQQNWLLTFNVPLSISDIEYLFQGYFLQIDHASFRSWLWDQAIVNKFNLETYFQTPDIYLQFLPLDKTSALKVLSPTLNRVEGDKFNNSHYFQNDPTAIKVQVPLTKEKVSHIARFYNDFKVLPYTSTQQIINDILPYITLTTYQQFFDLIQYTTFNQQLNLIEKSPFLEYIPAQYHAVWNRRSQQWLRPN
ncbi:MAG: hypothetical protein VXX85_02380 [Candidatus Margulisiibacteriota bacterium]|nr:hypothetical protein [Candidatus Margulisiibacteriota bacterium]